MIYPQLWAKSQLFKAIPILLKDEWVMHIEVNDQSLEDDILSLGLHLTKRHPHSFSVGYRGVMTQDQWLAIDRNCDFVEFDESQVFYADQTDYRLTPDYAIILSFASGLALHNEPLCEQLCLGQSFDDIWDSLSEQNITKDNALVWQGFVSAYCEAQGADAESIDLIQRIWKETCDALGESVAFEIPKRAPTENETDVSPVEQEEDIYVALAGTEVFYTIDGSEKRGRLSRSLLHSAPTAFLVNPEPHWVSGIPISHHIEVERDQVSLSPAITQPVIENFSHPLTFEHSLEDLASEHWNPDRGMNLLINDGLNQMLDDEDFQADAHLLCRVNDYAQKQLKDHFGSDNFTMIIQPTGWSVGTVSQSNHVRPISTLENRTKSGLFPVPTYMEAIAQTISVCSPIVQRNVGVLENYEALGINGGALIRNSLVVADQLTLLQTSQDLAFNLIDLEDKEQVRSLIFRSSVSAQMRFIGKIGVADVDGELHLYQTLTGRVVGCDGVPKADPQSVTVQDHLLDRVSTMSMLSGATAVEVVELYLGSVNFTAPDNAEALHLASVMDESRQMISLASTGENTRQILSDYVSIKLASFKPFLNTGERFLEATADRYVHQLNDDLAVGIVTVASNTRSRRKVVTTAMLWRDYNGDREKAYQFVAAELKQTRGMRSGSVFVLDRMEALEPHLSKRVYSQFSEFQAAASVAATDLLETGDAKERQDTGLVSGMAKKDFFRLNKADMASFISKSDPSSWAKLLSKSSIWPKLKFETLTKTAQSAEAAYVAHLLRNALPTTFGNLTGNVEAVAEYIQIVREARDVVLQKMTLEEAITCANEYLDKLGAVSEVGNWPKPEGALGALRAKWTRTARKPLFDLRRAHAWEDTYVADPFYSQNATWDFAQPKTKESAMVARRSLADIPALSHIERVGPAWRDDKTAGTTSLLGDQGVSEKDLIMTFGFSGIEYGNWTNQKEREAYMIHTYDAFSDLADITGLPKAALSLGGQLGLTYGSRGHGGKGAAMAHFEPSNMAIALTKVKGAGSLGHEYFHALSNYFFQQFSAGSRHGDIAEVTAQLFTRDKFDTEFLIANAGGMRTETLSNFAKLYWVMTHQPKDGDWTGFDSHTPAQDLRNILVEPAKWVSDSKKQDQTDRRKVAYWSSPCELFARGMESWAVSALEAENRKNDYLVRDGRIGSDTGEAFSVYPHGQQVKHLGHAVSEFFGALKWETKIINHPIGEDMVLPIMYSRWGDCLRVPVEILAEQALHEVKAMLGDHVQVGFENALLDLNGREVSGQWLPTLRAIELSNELATLGTVRHELFHAGRHLLMTNEEVETLNKAYMPGEPAMNELCKALAQQGKKALIQVVLNSQEEAQAYAFQLYCQGDLDMSGGSPEKSVFKRIMEFLKEIFSVALGYGVETPEKIFNSLQDGGLLIRADNWGFPEANQSSEVNDLVTKTAGISL